MGGNGSEAIDIRYLLSSIFFWIVCSLVILPLAALVAHIFRLGENAMAYLSSSLSFATAAAAGARAINLRRKNALGTAAVTGVCIIILALTLGFIIAGDKLDAAGILSVVSFTLSGALVGAVFFPAKKKQTRKKQFNISRKNK